MSEYKRTLLSFAVFSPSIEVWFVNQLWLSYSTPSKSNFSRRPNCNGVLFARCSLSRVYQVRAHVMIGLAYIILSQRTCLRHNCIVYSQAGYQGPVLFSSPSKEMDREPGIDVDELILMVSWWCVGQNLFSDHLTAYLRESCTQLFHTSTRFVLANTKPVSRFSEQMFMKPN